MNDLIESSFILAIIITFINLVLMVYPFFRELKYLKEDARDYKKQKELLKKYKIKEGTVLKDKKYNDVIKITKIKKQLFDDIKLYVIIDKIERIYRANYFDFYRYKIFNNFDELE